MNTENICIKQATLADLEAVQRCAREAYAKYLSRIGREPAPMIADFASQIEAQKVHIAVCDDSMLGYIVFYPKSNCIHLENVAVFPEHAGNGIGRKLIAFVEQTALAKQYAAVELYTNEAMFENLLMYPKMGYQEIERKTQDGFSRVFFKKMLIE